MKHQNPHKLVLDGIVSEYKSIISELSLQMAMEENENRKALIDMQRDIISKCLDSANAGLTAANDMDIAQSNSKGYMPPNFSAN